MSECERSGRWFSGCRFEARYDEPVLSDREKTFGRDGTWEPIPGTNRIRYVTPPLGNRTYVHDICIRCGKVVSRANLADATKKETP